VAYREQAELFLGGERVYTKIVGQTGPCVYPAVHLYVFAFFHALTDEGRSILKAQIIFMIIYLWQMYEVLQIYRQSILLKEQRSLKFLVTLGLLCISKRVHSIYVLRCFNDCIAMLFVTLAIKNLQR